MDGILYTIPKSVNLDAILSEWEKLTKLTLETEQYEAFYQFAINDYLAVGKGYSETKNPKLLKYKGLFIEENSLGKGMAPAIIAKAINKSLIDNIPVQQTIYASKDINDFLTYQKVDKKFAVEYNGKLIQRINRYYASIDGCSLYKCVVEKEDTKVPAVIIHYKDGLQEMVPETDVDSGGKHWYDPDIKQIEYGSYFLIKKGTRTNYTNLLSSSGVTIVNKLSDIKEFPKNINYLYYIKECYSILDKLKTQQLTLF